MKTYENTPPETPQNTSKTPRNTSKHLKSLQKPTRNTSTEMSNKEQKCNAGEILVCKARESHRISDGRYGRNSRKNQKCSCQPETDLSDMGMDVLGNGQ